MKKTATIFLLVLMVSIQTPLGQLFKLPLLVEHYMKHQKQYSVSLIGFLEEHYASNHKDADWPEDEQLPFKNITFHSIGYAIVSPIAQTNALVPTPVEKDIIFPDSSIPQQHLGSIFHPPRM